MDNHYFTLGVSFRATPDEIKSAYKRLAIQYHPDKHQGNKEFEEKFKAISAAYNTLSNPDKKNRYDLKLFYQTATASGSQMAGNYGVPGAKVHKYAARDPYFRRQNRSQEKANERTVKANFSIQNFAIAMLIMASIGMLALWFGNIMNRNTAKVHLEHGDFVGALEFDPHFGEAYFAKAKHLKKMGLAPASVIKELDKAIKYAEKQNPDMYFSRALEWMRLDDYEKAVLDLQVANSLDTTSANTLVLLGDLLNYNLQKYDQAECVYRKALRKGAETNLVNAGMGLAQLKQKHFVQAKNTFTKGLLGNAEDVDLYYYRGLTYLELKDTSAACADLDKALTMGKEEVLPLYTQLCKPN